MSTDAEPGGCRCGPPHCKAVVAAGTKTGAATRMALSTLLPHKGPWELSPIEAVEAGEKAVGHHDWHAWLRRDGL